MFEIERVYGQYNDVTGLTEWFFPAREGVFGPFANKETALRALEEFKHIVSRMPTMELYCEWQRRSPNLRNGFELRLMPLDRCQYQSRQRHCE